MDHIDVRIHRLGDPPIEDLRLLSEAGAITEAPQDIAPILTFIEHGTEAGKPKVGIFVPFLRARVQPDGSMSFGEVAYLYREVTLTNWITATGAAAGAFPEAFEGGIFDALAARSRAHKAIGLLTPLLEDLDDGPVGKAVAESITALLGFEAGDLEHVTEEDIQDAVARAAESMRHQDGTWRDA